MSQNGVRRAVELDNVSSSPEELEASRLLLLSSIGHALLDSTEEGNKRHEQPQSNGRTTVETSQGSSSNNKERGFVMPLKRKPMNKTQQKDAAAVAARGAAPSTVKCHSANSRDLVPHELPPDAFGEYPSLELDSSGYLSEARPMVAMSMVDNRGCSQTNTVLHLARSPPATYDDLYGPTPPRHTKNIQSTIQFDRPPKTAPTTATESELPRKRVVEPPAEISQRKDPPLEQKATSRIDASQKGHKGHKASSEHKFDDGRHNTVNEHVDGGVANVNCVATVAAEPTQQTSAAGLQQRQSDAAREPGEAGTSSKACEDVLKPVEVDRKGAENRQTGGDDMNEGDDDNLHGLIEYIDDGENTVGANPGGLSPTAMGLIEDYVPGKDVIDLEDCRSDEQRPESSRRSRPFDELFVKLSEEDEALLFEEAPRVPKEELKEPIADQQEHIICAEVIDLDDDEEEGTAGHGSPRSSAYSEISSMDGVPLKE
ncbi:hypothetical protein FOL47_005292 [Perkinsus chesapeaki]|uniref:Uncharacterized protein n=1 Tax=Perkinsus chesapeaki TaxID=330153 RepID=A0A7J6LXX2_PERCH|nr:hypothetical protein FOL47_005292 [Perkinsus chesapeaki]